MNSNPSSTSFSGIITFRFSFLYFILFFNPLGYFSGIPVLEWLPQLVRLPFDALTFFLNDRLFHIKPVLNQFGGGSGDTSFGWAQQFTFLILSGLGALVWTIADPKSKSYPKLHYWLCILVRFTLAGVSFSYGILKVFAMQMHFPNMSQMATPLGDYLPMRFSWMFIGYSAPYQIFSGLAEVAVGLLLFWRKTALLGALLAVGVFANVVMLNYSYDIPVKIYSSNLLIASIFLVWQERNRLISFFIQNSPTVPSLLFEKAYSIKWQKATRIVLKTAFFLFTFGFTLADTFSYYQDTKQQNTKVLEPIRPGMYHVELFVKNGDTIPESLADSLRWRDVIFDYNGQGSFSAQDSSFRMRYGRAYFSYQPDSLGSKLDWKISAFDRESLVSFAMQIPEDDRIILNGQKGVDSLYLVLKKLNRHFQITERQFHWISESNR
ncbi:MAG: hypothetical protein ACK4SF_16945 [Algoriphagus aquaeductus]|uniref:hypothetical protein n=1 Tax=Algoriphagus aquaeductus TaxID=475299 RepID=UPI00391BEF0C